MVRLKRGHIQAEPKARCQAASGSCGVKALTHFQSSSRAEARSAGPRPRDAGRGGHGQRAAFIYTARQDGDRQTKETATQRRQSGR